MNTSRLAGWPIPRVCLGTGTWPVNPATKQADVLSLLHHLLAGPKPFFDTAPMYGYSTSETWIENSSVAPQSRLKIAAACRPSGAVTLRNVRLPHA